MIVINGRFGLYKTKALLYKSVDYELYRTISDSNLLIVRQKLYQKWIDDKLFFAVNPFKTIRYEGEDYVFVASKEYQLIPVKYGAPLCGRKEATAFAFAIKQMRKITNTSLFDGIYIEEYGYVLPTYTDIVASDDATIGCYLSGGRNIHFSDSDFSALLLDKQAYEEIAAVTGIEKHFKQEQHKSNRQLTTKCDKFELAGRPELEKFFNEHIISILREPERYKRLGIDFPSSVLLYGPPGCGKTFAVDQLVEFLGLPKFEINSATVASPYIHDTAKKISGVFESAVNCAPSVVVIDEMESYLSNRESVASGSHQYEEVAEFLRQIQEAQKNKVIVIGMTNMYDKIDPAILRRGRFDHHLEVGYPSTEEILSLLTNLTKDISLSKDVLLSDIAKKLSGKTLADVAFVIKEAGLISGKNGDNEISNASINLAIESLPKEQKKRRIGFGTD